MEKSKLIRMLLNKDWNILIIWWFFMPFFPSYVRNTRPELPFIVSTIIKFLFSLELKTSKFYWKYKPSG